MLKILRSKQLAGLLKVPNYKFQVVKEDLSGERKSYQKGTLSEQSIEKNPFLEFQKWYHNAHSKKEIQEANAMILCTASKDGLPSGRPVLLKSFDETGFVFYTNYRSRKSRDLEENPNASLVFYWDVLEEVIRIEGQVEKIPEEQSDKYFHSRPIESQIGAWASPFQSGVVKDRNEIELKAKDMKEKFEEMTEILRPDFWGGWKVKPLYFEFWYKENNDIKVMCDVGREERVDFMIGSVLKESHLIKNGKRSDYPLEELLEIQECCDYYVFQPEDCLLINLLSVAH